MNLINLIQRVTPLFNDIKRDVELLRFDNSGLPPEKLSQLYIKNIRNKYTSIGVATSLPGVIPGMGTIAQVAVEAGTVSADLALMLRWMAAVCYGTAYIYGHDIEQDFEGEFTIVLGIWAGVLSPDEIATAKNTEITTGHFDKHIADRIKNRMTQKVWRKLATKYGAKRTGAIGGKLIPFGIGAIIGGAFNYTTMKRFGKTADEYFKPGKPKL